MPGKNKFKQIIYATGTTTGMYIQACPPPDGTIYYYYIEVKKDGKWYYYGDDGKQALTQAPQEATEFINELKANEVAHKISKQYQGAHVFTTTLSLRTPPYYYYIRTKHNDRIYYYSDSEYAWVKDEQNAKEFTDEKEAAAIVHELIKQYQGANVYKTNKSLHIPYYYIQVHLDSKWYYYGDDNSTWDKEENAKKFTSLQEAKDVAQEICEKYPNVIIVKQ